MCTNCGSEENSNVTCICRSHSPPLLPCASQVNLHGLDEGMIQKLNYGALHEFMAHVHRSTGMNKTEACRQVDNFVVGIARSAARSKNVELGGRDGFKTFRHGITGWIRNKRRVNGGWHIAMARHLRVFFTTTDLFPLALQTQFGEAYTLLMKVHTAVRIAVPKNGLVVYQGVINDLLNAMVQLCSPHVPSKCNSIKYHWPRHWQDTRRELGCSANEKSLERKLGETQKKNFKFTNGRNDVEVRPCVIIYVPLCHLTRAPMLHLCYPVPPHICPNVTLLCPNVTSHVALCCLRRCVAVTLGLFHHTNPYPLICPYSLRNKCAVVNQGHGSCETL
jgi:hypothetical protein